MSSNSANECTNGFSFLIGKKKNGAKGDFGCPYHHCSLGARTIPSFIRFLRLV